METSSAHVAQVSATSYSRDGVVGGGERIALYLDSALRAAAASASLPVTTTVLSLDGQAPQGRGRDRHQRIIGRAWDAHSLRADELCDRLRPADVVYVHQCMTEVGLFAAAHAKLLGKRVFGSDAGAGETEFLRNNPDLMTVYDGLHAISRFAARAYEGFNVPVFTVPGPVDTDAHRPPAEAVGRDPSLVVSVGRILPHKGFERTIRALPATMSLAIIGQHYDEDYLQFLRACAEGKQVRFESGLEDEAVQSLLHRAGTFVHASTHVDYRGRFYQKPELLGLAPLEALASGVPTMVSDAACLPELAVIPGCVVFQDDADLALHLAEAASGRRATPDPGVMHEAVQARYGLQKVGARLLEIMGLKTPCAS